MKNYPKSFFVAAMMACVALTSAYSPSDKSKLLVGKWVLIDLKTPSLENNFKASGLSLQKRTELMQAYVAGSYIEFRADGTYEVSILGSDPEVKYWKLSQDDSRLIVQKTPQSSIDEIELETLTKKELIMVLAPQNGEYVQLFFIPNKPE